MALVKFRNLTSGRGQSAAAFNTASITPIDNALTMITIGATRSGGSGFPNIPTISGNGYTWDQVNTTTLTSSGDERLVTFRAMKEGPTAEAIHIDFSGQTIGECYWIVDEITNVDKSGSNGVNAIVQSGMASTGSGTSLTVVLGSFASVHNATYGVIYMNDNSPNIVPLGSFTEITEEAADHRIQSQYAITNQMNVGWDVSPSTRALVAFACELKESSLGGGGLIPIL